MLRQQAGAWRDDAMMGSEVDGFKELRMLRAGVMKGLETWDNSIYTMTSSGLWLVSLSRTAPLSPTRPRRRSRQAPPFRQSPFMCCARQRDWHFQRTRKPNPTRSRSTSNLPLPSQSSTMADEEPEENYVLGPPVAPLETDWRTRQYVPPSAEVPPAGCSQHAVTT
jgi:hypothetical protein